MRDFLLVLRAHVGVSWRRLGRGGRAAGLLLLGIGLVVGFAALLARGTVVMLRGLHDVLAGYPELVPAVEGNLLLMWSLFVVAIVLSNALHTTYATLYGSDDTGFLLATPLSTRSVFAARLTASMAGYVAVAVPTFGPFVAYGMAYGAGARYYVTAALAYFGFLALMVAVAALFITLVMAFVPGARLKQWLMTLGLLIGLAIVFGTQYVAAGVDRQGGVVALLQRIGGFNLGGIPVLPHVWLARATQAAVAGGGLNYVLALLGLTALAGFVLVNYASRVYTVGWAGGQEAQRRRVRAPRRRSTTTAAAKGRSPLASPFWGLARKDFLASARTPVLWYLLLVGAVVVAFQIINMVRARSGQPVDEGVRLLLLGFVLGGASFSGSVLAGSAFSREGGNFGLVQSWPVPATTVFLGKVAAALPVPLAASVAGLLAVSRFTPVAFAPLWRYLPVVVLSILSVLSLMALLDTFFPDFSYEKGFEPGSRGSGTTVIKTLVSVYGGIGIIVLMMATLSFGFTYGRFGWAQSLTQGQAGALAYALFVAEAALFTVGAVALGSRRLAALAQRDVRRR